MRHPLVFLLAMTLGASSAWALDPNRQPHQHLHRSWGIDDGLPQNTVDSITQTGDGYLWLATQEGLVRYDGLRFTVFDRYNTEAFLESQVNSLSEGPDGALWIASHHGLLRYVEDSFTRFARPDGVPNMQVNVVTADAQGNVWIGTRSGLALYRNGVFTTWTKAAGTLADDNIMSLAVAEDGSLWVGTASSLLHYADGAFETLLEGTAAVGIGVEAILPEKGTVWVGTHGGGLYAFAGDARQRFTADNGLPSNEATDLLRDRDGNLWIGTYQHGLVRYRDGTFYRLTEAHGLSSDWIAALYEDREGNLWVGTGAAGLNRFWDGRFTTLTEADGLLDDLVWAVYEAPDGATWVGTERGATRLLGGRVTTYGPQAGLVYRGPAAFLQTERGVWIGTEKGLTLIAGDTRRDYTTADGLAHGDVRSILQDRKGDLWLGTHGAGLNRMRNDAFEVFDTTDGLVYDDVTSMLEDHTGAIWIGTDQGMSRLSDGVFQSFRKAEGLVDSGVYSFHLDDEEVLWIGTDGGLFRFRQNELVRFTAADGLADDKAYTILEDDLGYLWMSCNKGVHRAKKSDLNAFADGKVERIGSRLFGRKDGMRSVECNFAGGNAGWRMSDGRLMFGTIAGVAIIDPKAETTTEPPPIALERVIADGLPVAHHETGWRSPAGVENVEFHYTAPSFLAPEDLSFQYRLLGLDNRWRSAANRRVVNYANLDPGRYTFEVTAVASDGTRSPAPAAFRFYLTPTFFETIYFYLLIGLAAGVFGLILHQWRLRQHKQREAVLERMVEDRTHQLSQVNEQLKQLSFRDVLTGLRNRRFLLDTIEKEVAAVARDHFPDKRDAQGDESDLVFVMIDLDRFKMVNDTHGHAAGDQVLMQAAKLLQNLARTSDTIARWGGEEFLMVARKLDRESAHHLAERIREAFAEKRFELGNGETATVTCSLGYAPFPFCPDQPHRFNWEEVVALADQALYAAKHSGRAMWVGLQSTERSADLSLHTMFRTGVGPMLAEGLLRAESSAPPDELVWQAAS